MKFLIRDNKDKILATANTLEEAKKIAEILSFKTTVYLDTDEASYEYPRKYPTRF